MWWRTVWMLALAFWAHLCAQQVAFERGFYSFETIAHKLSVGGRQVVCEPTLKQRMALLSLKAREWEAMRQLLQKGLDLEIVCVDQEKNQWRLQRDRQVVAREKQLRARLVEVIADRLLGKQPMHYPNWFLLLSCLPPGIPTTEWQALQTWLERFEAFQKENWASGSFEETSLREILARQLADFGVAPDCPMLTRWAREQAALPRAEFLRRFGTYFGELMLSLDEERRVQYILGAVAEGMRASPRILLSAQVYRFVQSRLPIREAILRAIEQGEVLQVEVLPSTISALLPEEKVETQEDATSNCLGSIPSYTCILIYSNELDSDNLEFRFEGYVFAAPQRKLSLWDDNSRVSIQCSTEDLIRLFKEVDESFCTQYEEATRLHRRSVQDPRYQTPIDLTIKRRFPNDREEEYVADNFYVFLDRFSQQCQQEVIAEVYPHRGSLRVDPEGDRRATLIKVDSLVASGGVWRVEQVDGVWVWRNWLAFVDRVPDFPLAALHQLVFSPRTPANWRRFVQQTPPTQAKWLTLAPNFPNAELLFGSTEWLGPFPFVGRQWLMFRLLERVPSWEMRLRQAGELEYPLGQLPAFVLRRWVSELVQVDGKAFSDEAWEVCAWLRQENALVEALQQVGRLHLRHGKTMFGEVLLGDKKIVGCPLPINLPKQK